MFDLQESISLILSNDAEEYEGKVRTMKVCVVQPEYSLNYQDSDRLYQWEMDMMGKCDESMDIIVFPEYSNIPALAKTKEQMLQSYEKYTEPLLKKAAETAKRCGAILFIDVIYMSECGLRNRIVAFGRDGEIAGYYDKQHLVPSEMFKYELDKDYTYEFSEPTIVTIDGIKFGFLICYDFYFYEAFSNIARYNPDVIIACSHQRSDSHDALETMSKFCAYNCNAYLIRSSVSLGGESLVGGTSLIVEPSGNILVNLQNQVGFGIADIDPHKRYLKPAGFGNPPDVHHNYVERGRRPWKYRPGGSAIVCPHDVMPYPRVGICDSADDNTVDSLEKFGAAVALGVHEIGIEIWAESEAGLEKLEQIMKKLSCHAVMRIKIRTKSENTVVSSQYVNCIKSLIKKYDCERYSYFMLEDETQKSVEGTVYVFDVNSVKELLWKE